MSFKTTGGGTSLTGLGTDNRVARWDGANTIQSSGVTLNDTDDITGINDLTVTGDFVFGDAATDVLTINGQLHLGDDIEQTFGNTAAAPNVTMTYETADANANHLLITAPEGGAVDVPVLAFGDATAAGADLGLFNGITHPTIAAISDDGAKYISMHNTGTDGFIKVPSGTIGINVASVTGLWISTNGAQLADDKRLLLGTSSTDGQLLFETADANANAVLLALPDGDATNVPVFVIGDQGAPTVINADLGLFDGITDPTLAILDASNADYVSISHNGTDSIIRTNTGFIEFNAGSNNVRLPDDNGFLFGSSSDSTIIFETADANANELIIALPDGGATNVPVLVIGDKGAPSVVNADLGLFDGVVDPSLAVIDQTNADYMRLSHDGTDASIIANAGTIKLQRTSAADESLITLTADVQSTGATGDNDSLTSLKTTGTFNNAGQTLTNYYGLYASALSKPAGIVQNVYGLYIEDINNASATNNAVYSAGGRWQVLLNAGNMFTIDADTTDHTGANTFLVDLGVNSASCDAIAADVTVGTALSAGETVNGLAIDINGNAGDDATSAMNGIYLTSANATGGVNTAMKVEGTWDTGMSILADTDSTHIFGRVKTGNAGSDQAAWGHYDMNLAGNQYAIVQLSTGQTYLNAATGQPLNLAINGAIKWAVTAGALTSTADVISAAADTDTTHIFGRNKLWSPTSDQATFAHYDMVSLAQSAISQNAAGWTRLNAKTGQEIFIGIAGGTSMTIESTGFVNIEPDYPFSVGYGDTYTPTGYRTEVDHVQTTDATATNIWTIAVAEQETFRVRAEVVAQETSDAERAMYHIEGLFYRAAAGALTQQGVTVSLNTIESDATWGCDFNLNSNTLELQVTGAVGDTVNWVSVVHYIEVNDS